MRRLFLFLALVILSGAKDLSSQYNISLPMAICDAGVQSGVDAAAKISACLSALPSTGGVVDARDLTGVQTWGTTVVVTKPAKLLLGAATFTYAPASPVGPMIRFDDSATTKGDLVIEGLGMGGTGAGPAATILINNTDYDCIQSRRSMGNGRLFVRDLRIDSAKSPLSLTSAGVDVDFQDGPGGTSIGFGLRNVTIASHAYGVRHNTAINGEITNVTVGGARRDAFIQFGISSAHYENTYAVSTTGNGYYLSAAYYPLPWQGSSPYTVNARIAATPDNGHRFKCTAAGTSGSVQPSWNTGAGTTTSDGTAVWTEDGANAPEWAASAAYALNALVGAMPDNGHQYKCTTAGTTAATPPAFPTGAGATVTDGTVVWTENGSSNYLVSSLISANFHTTNNDTPGVDGYLLQDFQGVLSNINLDGNGWGRYGLNLYNPDFAVVLFPNLSSAVAGSSHAIQISNQNNAQTSVQIIAPSLAPRNNASVYGINMADTSAIATLIGGGFTGASGNFFSDPNGKLTRLGINNTSSAILTGLIQDSTGFKHQNVTTGSIAAAGSSAVTLTWTTAFADANYDAQCSVVEATASTSTLRVHHIQSIAAASVVVRVVNDDGGGAHTGTLYCTGIHN